MFDMRYHIASLVAVFLALALGILVGTSIVNNNVLENQQRKLIDNINASIKKVKVENSALNDQVSSYGDFEEAIFPNLVKGKLKNKNIAIITFEGNNDRELESRAENWLNLAGAKTSSISINSKAFDFNKEEIKELLKYLPDAKDPDIKQDVINQVFAELAAGKNNAVVSFLEKKGYLDRGGQLKTPIAGIVFLISSNLKNVDKNQVSIAMGSSARISTVIAEPSTTLPTSLSPFVSAKLSTIDNIDYPSGGYSAIYVLLGKKGNYGFKEDAQKISPVN